MNRFIEPNRTSERATGRLQSKFPRLQYLHRRRRDDEILDRIEHHLPGRSKRIYLM